MANNNQSKTSARLTIGRLAKQAGVGIDTVRFYERRGLLPEPERTMAGYRVYGDDTAARILFIRRAKRLGFTLDEIATLLRLQDHGGKKAEVRSLTQHKLDEINAKISDLKRIRSVLQDLSASCSGKGNVDGCPIIEAISSMPT
ncbi:MAG: MerR family DNA-binding protein [Gammaproteobacteria bacterium]|jgi:MerR family copper efflux transcriptional regulator